MLRLWVASVDYASDVRIGPNTIKQVFEQYRKLRNTLRYLAGNVNDVPVRDGSAEWTAKYVLPRGYRGRGGRPRRGHFAEDDFFHQLLHTRRAPPGGP